VTTDTALEETRNTAYITALEDVLDRLEIDRSQELDGYIHAGITRAILRIRLMKLEKEQAIVISPPPC
jgi:hypothetical protein